MVKNSGKKRRAKRYAAEHGFTYQQAREALDAQHAQDALASFVAECESSPTTPADRAGNLPFGKNRDGIMQWILPTVADDGWNPAVFCDPPWDAGSSSPIEIVGGAGTGKTTLLSRMIAHWATEKPTPRSVLLYAGEREFTSACARWQKWSQVVVIGPEGQVGGTSGNVREGGISKARDISDDAQALRVFDDWFTKKNGLVPRYTRSEISHLPEAHPVRWRARIAATASVAAFRPGHVSHLDESEEIRSAFARGTAEVFSRGFVARDEFVFDPDEDSDLPDAWPASMVIVPDGEVPYVWEARLDGRRLGLPVKISAGPGRLMYAEKPTELTEHTSPKEVSEFAQHMWYMRSDNAVDVDFPFVSGPRNRDVELSGGARFHAFPSLDVFPDDMDSSTEGGADAAVEKTLAAYWSIGERGFQEVEVNDHTTQPSPSWTWPTSEDLECLGRFLQAPGAVIEEHQRPAMISAKHTDGASLWATALDPHPATSDRIPQWLVESLMNPVIAESREALSERMKDTAQKARAYGAGVQSRSPLQRRPGLNADIEALARQARKLRSRDQ